MTEYDNTNRGALWKNDRKRGDNDPDYTGKIDVNGVEMWLSAWIKKGAKGSFMSLSVKPKDAPNARPKPAYKPPAPRHDMLDDEIPF